MRVLIGQSGNRLVVDTTQIPATYSGFGQTEGVAEIRLAEGCGDGAVSTHPRLI